MIRIAILVGSTRPGRKAPVVAQWVFDQTRSRRDAEFEIVDLADVDLPRLNEATPALFGSYQQPYTRRWAERIDAFDGFVFVTPEYNHSFPAVVKDALDYLFAEWNDKPCGFVSYGVAGGVRAVEHLRVVVGELKMADVRSQVALGLENITDSAVEASDWQHTALATLVDELVAWAGALQPLRTSRQAVSA